MTAKMNVLSAHLPSSLPSLYTTPTIKMKEVLLKSFQFHSVGTYITDNERKRSSCTLIIAMVLY